MVFTWDRSRLFDNFAAMLFCKPCVLHPKAPITQVLLPLLQVICSRILKILP